MLWSGSLRKIIVARVCVLGVLSLLSACLTLSVLHVTYPRSIAAPNIVVPQVSPPKKVFNSETVYSVPVRLEITKLSVDAPVIAAGLAQDNAMDIGDDPAKTAWYKLGPKPGEKGNAVIAGHYGWIDGRGSVFNGLHTLQPGDKITAYDEKGLAIKFTVREVRSYGLDADATEVFRSTDEKSHLNLITCGGRWDYPRQTYSDRLVVFSDLET